MQQAVHFDTIFKASPGTRHVQLKLNGDVIFDGTMDQEGQTQPVDVTQPITNGLGRVELGIITDGGGFHSCRYLSRDFFDGTGSAPFEPDLPDDIGTFPPSPAQFDTEAATGLPPSGGGTFELNFTGRLL
ncbi:hypothetical protein AB0D74_45190 [Streptomyces sp. NPDC048278]|uniref:hypothetical protein n=1 Tax=Streptomyces sp. NPDC048278 TaxID=3155809 RepID=UPI003441DB2E